MQGEPRPVSVEGLKKELTIVGRLDHGNFSIDGLELLAVGDGLECMSTRQELCHLVSKVKGQFQDLLRSFIYGRDRESVAAQELRALELVIDIWVVGSGHGNALSGDLSVDLHFAVKPKSACLWPGRPICMPQREPAAEPEQQSPWWLGADVDDSHYACEIGVGAGDDRLSPDTTRTIASLFMMAVKLMADNPHRTSMYSLQDTVRDLDARVATDAKTLASFTTPGGCTVNLALILDLAIKGHAAICSRSGITLSLGYVDPLRLHRLETVLLDWNIEESVRLALDTGATTGIRRGHVQAAEPCGRRTWPVHAYVPDMRSPDEVEVERLKRRERIGEQRLLLSMTRLVQLMLRRNRSGDLAINGAASSDDIEPPSCKLPSLVVEVAVLAMTEDIMSQLDSPHVCVQRVIEWAVSCFPTSVDGINRKAAVRDAVIPGSRRSVLCLVPEKERLQLGNELQEWFERLKQGGVFDSAKKLLAFVRRRVMLTIATEDLMRLRGVERKVVRLKDLFSDVVHMRSADSEPLKMRLEMSKMTIPFRTTALRMRLEEYEGSFSELVETARKSDTDLHVSLDLERAIADTSAHDQAALKELEAQLCKRLGDQVTGLIRARIGTVKVPVGADRDMSELAFLDYRNSTTVCWSWAAEVDKSGPRSRLTKLLISLHHGTDEALARRRPDSGGGSGSSAEA